MLVAAMWQPYENCHDPAGLTKFGKIFGEGKETDLTKISKAPKPTKPNVRPNDVVGKFQQLEDANTKNIIDINPKFYILNSINNQKENSSSGGVEAIIKKAT